MRGREKNEKTNYFKICFKKKNEKKNRNVRKIK